MKPNIQNNSRHFSTFKVISSQYFPLNYKLSEELPAKKSSIPAASFRFFINEVELFIENALAPNDRDTLTVKLDADLRNYGMGTTTVFGKMSGAWNGFKLEMNAGSDHFFQGAIASKFVFSSARYSVFLYEKTLSCSIGGN